VREGVLGDLPGTERDADHLVELSDAGLEVAVDVDASRVVIARVDQHRGSG